MSLRGREEMDPIYMWDLSDIFKDCDEWEAAFSEAEASVAQLPSLRGTLTGSKKALKTGLDAIYAAAEQVERVYLFANLRKESDNGDPLYQEIAGRAVNLFVEFSSAISFMSPELLSAGDEWLRKAAAYGALSAYRHELCDIARRRAHTLDERGEDMLSRLSDAASTPSDAFGMLESVDMTFPSTHDADGREVPLTHGTYQSFMSSGVREVRREAYEKYFGEFKRYVNTFAAMYGGSVKFDEYFAGVRSFDSARDAALFASNVPTEVYDSLVEAVHGGLPDMRRYTELRRRVLGLEQLEMYDLYCPIVSGVDREYTYEEACGLVLEACRPLGERYGELLRRAMNERWIDVYENRGKTTGAFSCGVYGVHPYVLMNFTGRLDDVFTLAHELGHAMHSYLSDEAQPFPSHDYKITVAEVASTVNEVLLTKYLLGAEDDPHRRAHILNHFLEGFRTTVFRQTLFAEFESRAHKMYRDGTPLTAESLGKLYRELNLTYYEGVNVGELHSVEWARIPHFYRAFYVYQYATGFCAATAIAQNITDSGDASEYLRFLTTGGSDYPTEELKIAGVDLTSPEPVRRALGVFAETVNEMERVMDSL